MIDVTSLAKLGGSRLAVIVAVGAGSLEAYLYATVGLVERIDDSIVGGLLLALALLFFKVAGHADGTKRGDAVFVMVFVVLGILLGTLALGLMLGREEHVFHLIRGT